jgi:hypothetical protein
MIAVRRPRKLTPGENNRLLGLAVGYLLGLFGLLVSSVVTTLGSVRGLGPDHWVLWVMRIVVVLGVILLSTFTVFFTRLRPVVDDTEDPRR